MQPCECKCSECRDTGVVFVGDEAIACTCEAGDFEWAAKLNRARELKAERPSEPRLRLAKVIDFPRSSADRDEHLEEHEA